MNKITFFLIFIFSAHYGFCQQNSGEIKYKILLSSDKNDNDYRKTAVNGSERLEFLLQFNNGNSIYKQLDKLDNNDPSVKLAAAFSGYINPIQYNGSKKVFRYNNTFSPLIDYNEFLIEFHDSIGWKLSTETKEINNYKCYKATTLRPIYRPNGITYFEVTAWYCPEIPLPFGPLDCANLPGLIFQLEHKYATIALESIEFNEKINFEELKKGKLISEIEYYKVFDIRSKEATQYLKNKK